MCQKENLYNVMASTHNTVGRAALSSFYTPDTTGMILGGFIRQRHMTAAIDRWHKTRRHCVGSLSVWPFQTSAHCVIFVQRYYEYRMNCIDLGIILILK